MDTTTPRPLALPARPAPAGRLALAALALALAAAGSWFAWLGWDHEYYLVDGVPQGPYRPWQVVGCAVTVVVAALVVQRWARGTAAIFTLAAAAAVGFAVPWSVDAASVDDTGLWVVGLVFLLVGAGIGLTLVLVLGEVVAGRPARR